MFWLRYVLTAFDVWCTTQVQLTVTSQIMNPRLVGIGIVVLIAIYLSTSSFVVVNAGHVGVVTTLGAVQPKPLEEGFHLKKPFIDQVEEIDIRLRKAENQASAASKDLQVVSTRVAVQYSRSASRRLGESMP